MSKAITDSNEHCPKCASPMLVNAQYPRQRWLSVQYRCTTCGKTKTVKVASNA